MIPADHLRLARGPPVSGHSARRLRAASAGCRRRTPHVPTSATRQLIHKIGVPFWPDAGWKDVVFALLVGSVVLILSIWLGPPSAGYASRSNCAASRSAARLVFPVVFRAAGVDPTGHRGRVHHWLPAGAGADVRPAAVPGALRRAESAASALGHWLRGRRWREHRGTDQHRLASAVVASPGQRPAAGLRRCRAWIRHSRQGAQLVRATRLHQLPRDRRLGWSAWTQPVDDWRLVVERPVDLAHSEWRAQHAGVRRHTHAAGNFRARRVPVEPRVDRRG